MDQSRLQQNFYKTPYGKEILKCIQCGTCSASCPLADEMDHAPREIFALIRDGEMEEALRSDTPWYCVSCYQCMIRCPRKIPVTDLMYVLKRMATAEGLVTSSHNIPDLYHAFTDVAERQGRISEPLVMVFYGIRHPGTAIGNIPLAFKLFQRRRLDLHPQKVRRPERMSQLLTNMDSQTDTT